MTEYTVKLTVSNVLDITMALTRWANLIETGNHVLTANDAAAMGKPAKPLELEQRERIANLRQLVQKIDKQCPLL